jgi:hypothetical protein
MHNQIGLVVLGSLSAVFSGYGLRELTLAYKTPALKPWSQRAVAATAVLFVAGVFAVMTRQILG